MKTVIAALDNSLAARPVLAAARALGRAMSAEAGAVHVGDDFAEGPRALAAAARVPLRIARGDVVATLVEIGAANDVAAMVIGARGLPTDVRPLGETAAAVATSVLKPVLVVPPEATLPSVFTRALVPLEGATSTSLAPRALIELARASRLEIVVVHVVEPESIPPFTDQPQHEQAAWAREFLNRYCPWGLDVVRFETRIGRSDELIPAVAEETRCELIALGWSQELAPGRAPVVRGTLGRSRSPVLLVPVRVVGELREHASATAVGDQS